MRDLHVLNAVVVIAANFLAAGWGFVYLRRRRTPGRLYAHVLALAQAVVIAQVAIGLLLLADGYSSPDSLHPWYGTLALLAVLSPWVYAPPVPARRLAWFTGAAFVAGALSIRAYVTGV